MSSRRSRQNGTEGTGRFWRSCLWLSLWVWSVPVPWLHCHEVLQAAGADGWLTQHLAVYHHDGDDSGDARGWHLHLLFARCPAEKPTGETPDDTAPDNEPPTVRLTEPTDLRRPLCDGDHMIVGMLPIDGAAAPCVPEGHAFLAGGFLRTYPRSVRLTELLSLWRC